MIVGIGIDLLEHNRVERELARAQWSAEDGIFSPAEIRYCNRSQRPARSYAICFAAKEATLKALGVESPDLHYWREVEINHIHGDDEVVLSGRAKRAAERLGYSQIHLAVASARQLSAAMVLVEAEAGKKGTL